MHRNLTIMFTDMKGFTPRTSAQSREENQRMIKQHNDLVVPILSTHGGTLIKSIGDAFLITFESPTDAVIAGVMLQNRIQDHNATVPKEKHFEIRVAINTGEVSVEDGDVHGEPVNIASRIEGVAEPNEVYFTESTYLSMNKREVPSAEIGYRVLKGIPDKIKLYRVLREGEAPPPRASDKPAKPLYPILIPAPRFRRTFAFSFDALLIYVLVAILMLPAFSKLSEQNKELRAEAQKFDNASKLVLRSKYDKKAIASILWGKDPLPEDMAAFPRIKERIEEFRAKRNKVTEVYQETTRKMNSAWGFCFLIYHFIAVGWKGRSLGKKLTHLKVVRLDGSRLTWGRSAVRSLLYLLSAGPLLLGFAWAFFDKRAQAWHDKIAETRVISDI